MAYIIATFSTRNGTMSYFNLSKRQGINCSLMNTPSGISVGCGLCVKFNEADLPIARALTTSVKTFGGFFLVNKINEKLIITRAT